MKEQCVFQSDLNELWYMMEEDGADYLGSFSIFALEDSLYCVRLLIICCSELQGLPSVCVAGMMWVEKYHEMLYTGNDALMWH